MEEKDVTKTGTTTLGMVCKDGVVMATETRATMGTLIAHKTTKKLYQIDNHLGLAWQPEIWRFSDLLHV